MAYTDIYGLIDTFVNGIYTNAPAWAREEATYKFLKVFDNEWKPIMSDIMPRSAAPSANGEVVSVDSMFYTLFTTDPQIMSPMADRRERTKPFAGNINRQGYQARMTRQGGPTMDPNQFKNEFKSGILDKINAPIVDIAMKSIERRIEYTDLQYVFGNTTLIEEHSPGVETSRKKTFDAGITDATSAKYLSGAAWDNYGSDPMHDINKICLYGREMMGKDIKQGFIGPNTAFALENNTKILSQIQYHTDATNTVIANTLKGVTLKTVMGQSYKDSTTNAGKIGYPGLGNATPDNWTTRAKVDFMKHTTGGTSYEWALFVPGGSIGATFTAKTYPGQTDPNVPYFHTWKDPELEYVYSSLSLGFCPYVADFADVIIVEAIAEAKV